MPTKGRRRWRQLGRSLSRDGSGAAAVEYALILAAFAGAILFVIFLLGNTLNHAKSEVAGQVPGTTVTTGDGGTAAGDGGRFIRTTGDGS